jgi:hypothetical protein
MERLVAAPRFEKILILHHCPTPGVRSAGVREAYMLAEHVGKRAFAVIGKWSVPGASLGQ